MVTVCSVRHGDDYLNLPQQLEKYNVEQEKYSSPFKSAMVVPVILGLIADNPGCTNKTLQGYLKEGIWEGVRFDGFNPARG